LYRVSVGESVAEAVADGVDDAVAAVFCPDSLAHPLRLPAAAAPAPVRTARRLVRSADASSRDW
jgi:hypothetical protein